MTLKIIIVGAGIAGLATALSLARNSKHEIIVLESSSALIEAGAGIQINPNACRVLYNWGLKEEIQKIGTNPQAVEIRRWDNAKLLGIIPANMQNYAERNWGYPHWLVHRIDYQQMLASAATKVGVEIKFSMKVKSIDCSTNTIFLENGSTHTADLIVGADGIHSRTRRSIPSLTDIQPIRAVNYCYRTLIPRSQMLKHPYTTELINSPNQIAWPGPKKHIIAYPISNGSFYNLVIPIPDANNSAPLASYNQPGSLSEMCSEFTSWNPEVTTLLSLAESCTKWTIAELPTLPTWSSTNSRVVLVGDAAHAMTPHAASGGATAIEDAEVLGQCLVRYDDLANAVRAYETERMPRCARIQEISRDNAVTFSMPDGPAQQTRDAKWLEALQNVENGENMQQKDIIPDMNMPYPSPPLMMWLYGYDASQIGGQDQRRIS